MSFLGGPECSTSSNPLSQLQKQFQNDRASQQNRFVGSSTALNSSQGFRSRPIQDGRQEERMQQFLHQTPKLQEFVPGSTHLEMSLRAEHFRVKPASPVWQSNKTIHHSTPPSAFSTEEFARFQDNLSRAPPVQAATTSTSSMLGPMRPILGPGMSTGYTRPGQMMAYSNMSRLEGYSNPRYDQDLDQMGQQTLDNGKGKGKQVAEQPVDWEQAFTKFDLGQHADQPVTMNAELDDFDERLINQETGFGDFESIWQGMKDGENENGFKWTDDDDWEPGRNEFLSGPTVGEYIFEHDNLFVDQMSAATLFEEGVRIMDEGGNLSLAALAFEAAVQQDPNHIQAWVRLGSAQAQNEKEDAALRALQHVLTLDPDNLDAIMGLAISYTNEGYDSTAYSYLERWLSVKYPQILPPASLTQAAQTGFTDRLQLHAKVTDLYVEAAQLSPDGEHMDPDVQVGLGVLFYGSTDYDKAVDCFHAALASSELGVTNHRSQVHLLWNRLGATLANSGRSEEAIEAYEKALALNPNFVRARYNLGVSCLNIGCYEQAAGHLLSALEMHDAARSSGKEKARELLSSRGDGRDITDDHLDRMAMMNPSSTLHDTLRRVFTLMGRKDLSDRLVFGMDPKVFKADFDF